MFLFQIGLTMLFNTIVYTMTQQPMELERFAWFSSVTVVLSLTSEGLGMLIGVMFNCTVRDITIDNLYYVTRSFYKRRKQNLKTH